MLSIETEKLDDLKLDLQSSRQTASHWKVKCQKGRTMSGIGKGIEALMESMTSTNIAQLNLHNENVASTNITQVVLKTLEWS